MTPTTVPRNSQAPTEGVVDVPGVLAHTTVHAPEVGERTTVEQPAAPDFASLLKFVHKLKQKERANYTPAADLMPAFLKALQACEIVSLDIFDTAVVRYVDHPVDVFFHLERQAAFAAHQFSQPVSKLRILAENTARSLVHKLISSAEVNLLEIYQVYCDQQGLSREHAESLLKAEEAVELELCVACPAIHRLYEEAIAAGKRVIFVSDTYHTEEFLRRLLAACNYVVGADALFASSAIRKSKQSGELFPRVIADLGIAPEAILHVGDNPVSDYQQPLVSGVPSILHTFKTSCEHATLPSYNGGPRSRGDDTLFGQHSLIRGMLSMVAQRAADCGEGDNFWWKFGYSSAGPLTVGFCQWLEQSLRRDGIERAYFLLRDGELMYEVYKALYRNDASACRISTLASSRRAMLLPIFEMAPAFVLPSLLAGVGLRPMREYVERLDISVAGLDPEVSKAGFSSADEQIDGRVDGTRLLSFITQPRVLSALIARSQVERAAMAAFLEQEGVTRQKKIALVDLGWFGTIHKSLHVLLSRLAPSVEVSGYYMATFPEAPHTVMPGFVAHSYLAHRGEPRDMYAGISQFLNLFESVYSNTEGSLLYFKRTSDGRVIPIRQAADKSNEFSLHLRAIHEGALAFTEDFQRCSAMSSLPSLPSHLAAEQILRVIMQPTSEEADMLGELTHCDNLGSTSMHSTAVLRSTTNPADLLEDYQKATWKQGILAKASDEGAALRSLIWLMQNLSKDG